MQARRCTPEQAATILRRVTGAKPNPGGKVDIAELTDGACFAVFDRRDKVIGGYCLQGHGSEVWVQAAAGSADIDLCDLFDDLIAKHGAGFQSIAFRTYRRGLVRKALKRGYSIVAEGDGFILRKYL